MLWGACLEGWGMKVACVGSLFSSVLTLLLTANLELVSPIQLQKNF